MSQWGNIALLGSTTYQASAAAPGPTVSYASAGGTTLIAAGYVDQPGTFGVAFSVTEGLTAITDDAGNAWQFSLVNAQTPPAIYGPFSPPPGNTVTFVAWCINAAPVTVVTFNCADTSGHNDTWNISLSEWSNVAWPDFGYAGGSGFSAPTGATAATRVSTPNDLVIGVLTTAAGTVTVTPPSTADLPGEVSTGAVSLRYALNPAVPASTFYYPPPGGNGGTTGGSSITSIYPPLDLCPGDLLIMDVVVYNATVSAWPTGFVQQLSVTGQMNAANQRFVATKIADGTETTLMTVTLSGAGTASGLCYSLRGAASSVPLNTATYTSGSGYTTTLTSPALTVTSPSDATIYGYGGITSARSAFNSISTTPSSLANLNSAFTGEGTLAVILWGVDVTVPGAASCQYAVDVLDWAMDIPALPTGVGGFTNWPWSLSGGVYHTWVMQSFGPVAITGPQAPPPPGMVRF